MDAETDEIIFASYFVSVPSNVSRVNLNTGEVTVVPISPSIGGAGGCASYLDGQVCSLFMGLVRLLSYSLCLSLAA